MGEVGGGVGEVIGEGGDELGSGGRSQFDFDPVEVLTGDEGD
jgi:hypothetical protein